MREARGQASRLTGKGSSIFLKTIQRYHKDIVHLALYIGRAYAHFMLTSYQARLFAEELQLHYPAGEVRSLTTTLLGSRVDLNPHQVDAALFAFRSPLSRGVLLADEVGLGKTIEAGIVMTQRWAEQRRHILILAPASLRTQWQQELQDKFQLPSIIMDRHLFDQLRCQGQDNPFDQQKIVIASYDFARKYESNLECIAWDLVVLDEAHRLRNVYNKGSIVAKTLRRALAHAPKLLLTATPLQNSLDELYGLISFIDDHHFCDIRTFRAQYGKPDTGALADLRRRLAPVCQRTLRRQVLEYIRYTERHALTEDFTPTPAEQDLYDQVTAFLRRDTLWSIPARNRNLMELVLRKLLASSSFAIAGALHTMTQRLNYILYNYENSRQEVPSSLLQGITRDYEVSLEEEPARYGIRGETISTEGEEEAIRSELMELTRMVSLADAITENAKGQALLSALKNGFRKARELGASPRAIIFTESRRTQEYLFQLLSQSGYENRIICFNGSNNDPQATRIYQAWKMRHAGSSRITGSRDVDVRSALVEAFRDEADIMIATEAASEGINLQFCSLVVNYDLPWNPQRIEQRIGRCHRYGQRHDVVVINFLNRANAADKRVFELLSDKFQLFSGIFGASDEILGSIESGVDFERRVAEIYQKCRSPEEIQTSFDALQESLSTQISAGLASARQKLLEHFDGEVAEKLHVYQAESNAALDRFGLLFWQVTQWALQDRADFQEEELAFTLRTSPIHQAPSGLYALATSPLREHATFYGPHEPLARWVLQQAVTRPTPPAQLHLSARNSSKKWTVLTPLQGTSGSLGVWKLRLQGLQSCEEHLFVVGCTSEGTPLSPEAARHLLDLPATVGTADPAPDTATLQALYEAAREAQLAFSQQRNGELFDQEMEKLNRWADERKQLLEMQIAEMDHAIREMRTAVRKCATLKEKVDKQRHIKVLEGKRNEMRRRLFEAQDSIEDDKDRLLDGIEAALRQEHQEERLFVVSWTLEA